MIDTVEKINWREELQTHRWFKALQEKIAAGDFRCTVNEVPRKIKEAIDSLKSTVNSFDRIDNLIAWLNYKAGKIIFDPPYNESIVYWIRINGEIIHMRFTDEYEGRGSLDIGLEVQYIDRGGSEEFWIDIINNLIRAARREFNHLDSFDPQEWSED